MRRFFGVSEELLPCAVVVSLLEKRAYAVALDDVPGLYALLKRVRVELEPVTTEIDRRDAELARAREARRALRSAGARSNLLARSRAQQWQWSVRLKCLAADLSDIAHQLPHSEAELCRSAITRFSSTMSTFMLSHLPHIDVTWSSRSSIGSGSGATSTSQESRTSGSPSGSMYSGLISTLPGASSTNVVSMCMGVRQRLAISWMRYPGPR
jgi:hypothetical protein